MRFVRLLGLGIGPLYDQAPPAGGKPTGDPAPGAPPAGGPSGGAGGGTGQPPASGQPPAGQPPADDRSGWIPRERFDQVAEENRRFKAAEEQRATDEAKKKGDYETLSAAEKAKREAAEQKAVRVARRAAFIGRASGKVADPDAAYKLAAADGKLEDIDVDDDGNAKDPKKLDAVVTDLLKTYEFLKPTGQSRDFGQPNGGTQPGPGKDPSKMSSTEMISAGYGANAPTLRNRGG